MPKPYDATIKQLIDAYAPDWLRWLRPRLGLPPDAEFDAIDADLGTLSLQADKLFRFRDPALGLANLELQSSADPELPNRLFMYSALATYRYNLPVHSVVLLLRREASLKNLNGVLRRKGPDGRDYLTFRYAVVRLWQLASEELLTGPIGLVPLAGLTDDAKPALPRVVERMNTRYRAELSAEAAGRMIATSYVLFGLRYNRKLTAKLYEGVTSMEESSTYQAILEKGEAKGRAKGEAIGRAAASREVIRILGEPKLGRPSIEQATALEGMDADRLLRLAAKLQTAASWDELLAVP